MIDGLTCSNYIMHVDFDMKMSDVKHIKVIIKNYDKNNLSSSTALFLQEHAIGLEKYWKT